MKLPASADAWRGQGVLARPALGWSAIEKGKAGNARCSSALPAAGPPQLRASGGQQRVFLSFVHEQHPQTGNVEPWHIVTCTAAHARDLGLSVGE